MATEKQKKVAELIVDNLSLDKPLNGGEMLEKVGYSEGITKSPSRVLQSDGVKEILEVMGFSEVKAKEVVASIMLNSEIDASSRLKATDQVFKVNGSYAPDKSINLNLNGDVMPTEDMEALAQQLNDIARNNNRTSIGGDGADAHALDIEAQD